MEEEEEAPELMSPRISFSHDLVVVAIATPPPLVSRSSSRLPASEPEFDFATNAVVAAADVAPADRLFAGGKLLPMPPLPPRPAAPKPTKPLQAACSTSSRVVVKQAQQQKAACQQQQISRRPAGSWASPFSRSSSVNSATTAATTTTTTTGAPRHAGRFGCPPFPLMRSCSVGSAAAVGARERDRGDVVSDAAPGHRPHHHHQYYKKFGNGGAGGSRAYYYGGSRKGSTSHGVRVGPVLNVPFIGTSVSNVLSYLLCDCSHRTNKSREF